MVKAKKGTENRDACGIQSPLSQMGVAENIDTQQSVSGPITFCGGDGYLFELFHVPTIHVDTARKHAEKDIPFMSRSKPIPNESEYAVVGAVTPEQIRNRERIK